MRAHRLARGGEIDRNRPISFSFDGQSFSGYEGDTLASALLAAGVRIVGRSVKYHRPRGIWGAWSEEPNATLDVTQNGRTTPNVRATTEWLSRDMVLRSVNTAPSAARDRFGFLDRLSPFLPAGFYYKTFMWPGWRVFEPGIRAMAGLGRLDPKQAPAAACPHISLVCDLLVVGAGPAGLAAARAAVTAGYSVVLADDQAFPGGSLLHRGGEIDGQPSRAWAEAAAGRVRAGGRYLERASVYGIYDHGLACAWQRRPGEPDALYHIRASKIVVAAGAIERPLVFSDNDRPGVMSAEAALVYLRRYGVLVGERIVIATNNDAAYVVAAALADAGATVAIADTRADGSAIRTAGFEVRLGVAVERVFGRSGVEAVIVGNERIAADCLLVSGGWNPTVHLFCQAGGKLRFDEALAAFVPVAPVASVTTVGAANGTFSLAGALAEGHCAAGCDPASAPQANDGDYVSAVDPAWPQPGSTGRQWIDFQSDVTLKDVEVAARENFRSVEHLKRYTTLGMATDQGKTSNVNGLAAMAAITGRSIPEVGTTTFRPPYVPVPLAAIGGRRRGELFNPVRRLVLENDHRSAGAVLREYGGWLRPAWYGAGQPQEEIHREASQARKSLGLFDASPLGKIEVMGPQAAALVDFSSYNTMSMLKPGRIRYGLMLTEAGHVYDDGVTLRVAEDHFIVSCSSGHVSGLHMRLEEWRQDRFDPARVVIHNSTAQWATLTATGPQAKALVKALALGVDLDDRGLPHMAFAEGRFEDMPVRIARVSFTGDRSYELSIPGRGAAALWARMREEGQRLGATLLGVEALMILRAEKGFVVAGKDTDGTTMPHDLGMKAPRKKRSDEFVGRRSLFTEEASREGRRQLVGIAVAEGEPPLPTGAHAVARDQGRMRSIGYVTSSYWSPNLNRPIALALLEDGMTRMGEAIEIFHLGAMRRAVVAKPCFLDPEGMRLDA